MAFKDPVSFDTIPRISQVSSPPPPPSPEYRVQMPESLAPDEALEWLQGQGWKAQYVHDRNTQLLIHNCWPGLWFEWHEAVAMEFLRFMSIGVVGQRKQQVSSNDGVQVSSSAFVK